MFLTKLRPINHLLNPSLSLSPISKHTLTHTQKHTQNPNPNEHIILNHLSLLLPIRDQFTPLITNPESTQKSTQKSTKKSTSLLSLLSPEDRLRGVFVQKPIRTAAVKQALTAAASDIVSVSSESDFREVVSKVLNRGGLDSEAIVTVFEWAVESGKMSGGVESYNVVFKALGRQRFLDKMRFLLGEMRGKGVRGDYETLEIFVDSYVKAKRVSKGVEILKNLDEFGMDEWDSECLKVVLRCLCRRGRVTSADKLLSKTRGRGKVEFDGEMYGIVIRGWCKLGRVSEVERVLSKMVEDGFDPDSL